MRLSEGNPFKTCANPEAHNQKLSRANLYENEMVKTYRDLNCSGASPIRIKLHKKPIITRIALANVHISSDLVTECSLFPSFCGPHVPFLGPFLWSSCLGPKKQQVPVDSQLVPENSSTGKTPKSPLPEICQRIEL